MIDIRKENLWLLPEAAAFCKVDRRTLDRWFKQGLEKVKLGGRVYTSRDAIHRFSLRHADRKTTARLNEDLDREAEAYLVRIGVS